MLPGLTSGALLPKADRNKAMELDQRLKALEDEVKILKNELKAVLLDIREQYLSCQNPFRTEPHLDGRRVRTVPLKGEEPDPMVHKVGKEEEPSAEPSMLEDKNEEQRSERPLTAPIFESNNGVKRQHNGKQKEMDLATIAGLTQWVDQTIQKIGKQRTEATIEGLYLMEHLPSGIKDFLLKFIHLSKAKEPQRQITTKDYLTALTQLEGLLGQGSTSEMALISILSTGQGDGNG